MKAKEVNRNESKGHFMDMKGNYRDGNEQKSNSRKLLY